MDYNVTSNRLSGSVAESVSEALENCAKRLPPEETVTVELFPLSELPEEMFGGGEQLQEAITVFREELYGVIGVTVGTDVSLYVDTDVDGHCSFLPNVVAHEYNHAVRYETSTRTQNRLADRLVLEGLAECFEVEITGREPPYARAVPVAAARSLFEGVKDELGSTDSQLHTAVFYGVDESDEFERWAGYTLAYHLIRESEPYTVHDWPELMDEDSKTLLEESTFVG